MKTIDEIKAEATDALTEEFNRALLDTPRVERLVAKLLPQLVNERAQLLIDQIELIDLDELESLEE